MMVRRRLVDSFINEGLRVNGHAPTRSTDISDMNRELLEHNLEPHPGFVQIFEVLNNERRSNQTKLIDSYKKVGHETDALLYYKSISNSGRHTRTQGSSITAYGQYQFLAIFVCVL